METIKGKVDRIIFSNEDTGFKVLRIRIPEGPILTITGEFGPEMIPGTIADFHGDYKIHPKYGTSFRAASYTITHNQEQINSLKTFLSSTVFNIGPERAEAIVNYFGNDLVRVLDEEPDRLNEVNGIGSVLSNNIKETWIKEKQNWMENRQQYSLRAFLNNLGLKEYKIKKILSYFGGMNAESRIRENPYILTEIEGFGFSTADHIAKQLGIPDHDPARLQAFIYYVLKVLCPESGHLFMTLDDITSVVNKYCTRMITTFIGKEKVEKDDLIDLIKNLKDDKLIEEDDGAIYSKDCFNYEVSSAILLSNIIKKPSDLILLEAKDINKHIKDFERENQISLSKEQRKALYYFVKEKVFILTGGPGTGKTRTLEAIVSLIKKLHLNLTCLTPTGISAKKMAETIKYDAYTIHRCLGFRGNYWMYNETNKFETDVIIIDEASMLDQEVLFRLLSAVKDRVHIIFVGDDDQLPSVGAGNVLREIINCGVIPVVRLEQIFRQNETSDIVKVAHQIKNGSADLSLFKSDFKADVFFLRESRIEEIEKIIIKLAQKLKDNKQKTFQLLSPRNQGPLSVDSLNSTLQDVLNPRTPGLPEIKCHNFILRKGDRVKVKKNDYERSIFNGDIGKVIYIGGGYVEIDIDGRPVQLTVDEIDEKIKLAYALSVHASQGQEYQYIILPFINQYGKMLLQRNLLYTAITRAKEKVIIIGHGSAIEKAINNTSVYKRNTKLGERICSRIKKKDSLLELPEKLVSFPPVIINKEPLLSKDTAS